MKSKKILLVEDEIIEAMDIKRTLEAFDYEVPLVASSGEEAVEKALEIMPDLVLMDVLLKGEIDGIQAALKIKELNIPVIFLTAHSEDSTFQRALETEPYGYLLKPYEATELRYTIEMALYKKMMDNKLEKSQEKFRLLTETLDDIIYVVDLKKQKIVYISSAVEKITGWSTESFYENQDLWMEIMIPEDRQMVMSHISKLGSKLGGEDKKKKIEYRIKTKDGQMKWLSDVFKFTSDEKGEPLQVIGHAADITLEKESASQLQESEKNYRNLVDNAMVGVFSSNLKGDILFANEAMVDMFHFDSVGDLKANNIQKLYKNPEERQSILQKLKKEGFITNYETEAVGKNGEMIKVLVSINLDGETLSGMFMDITGLKIAEDKLARSESRYRAIFDNSGALLLTFADDGTILMFNTEWQRVSGYSKEEVEGKKWMDFVHPDHLEQMMEYHQKRLKDPESVPNRYETVFINKNGEERVMYITVTQLPGTDNWLVSAIDITDLKNTQKRLEKNILRFRALAQNALEGIITTDSHGKILYFNKSLEKMFGYSREELKNSELTILMPERYRKNFMADLTKFRSTGEHRLAGRTIETIGRKKDGSEFPFEMSLSKWEIENHVYFTSIIRDITERIKGWESRKRGEAALRESEEKYRALMDYSSDAIFLADLEGKIIECNKKGEELLGYTQNELLKLNIKDIHPPEELERVLKHVEKYLKGDMDVVDTLVLTKDKKKIPVAITGSLIEYGDKKVLQGIFRDISRRKKAEYALRASEEKYKTLFESNPNYTILVGLDCILLDFNEAAQQVTGISKEESIGKHFLGFGIFPEDDLDYQEEKFSNLFKYENVAPYESRIIDKNGDIRYGETFLTIIKKDDAPDYIQVICSDITGRKKAEKALYESEEKYRTLFEHDPNYTILIGPDGELLDVNKAAEQITGFSREELIGKRFNELKIFPEEELDLHGEMFLDTLKHGIITPYKARIVDKNGKIRWVLNQSTIIKKDDVISYVLVIGRDITDHERAEKARRESEEHLRFITDNMNDVIGQVNAEGIITYFSPSLKQLIGYEPQEWIGKDGTDLIHPEDLEYVEQVIQKAITTRKPMVIEYRTKKADGTYIWVEVGGKAAYDDNGDFKSIIFVSRDIGDRKRADDALKESLQEKEVLLREIHHRVKNNMQIISSLLNLQIQYEDVDETVGVLKDSQGRVKSMAMVHEKLYQSGSFSKINFKDYLTNLLSDIFYSYGIKKGDISWELDIGDLNINIDTAIPLGLIINELVTNSVKYAFPDSKGVIIIKLKENDGRLELLVKDNGIGIPENVGIENTDTLGLQLVNNLTNQLDGKIELDRSHGTEFKISFKELEYKNRI